jgi:hypothetical protein
MLSLFYSDWFLGWTWWDLNFWLGGRLTLFLIVLGFWRKLIPESPETSEALCRHRALSASEN